MVEDHRFDSVLASVRDAVARRARADDHLETHGVITLREDIDYVMQAVSGATEDEVRREIALYDARQNALVPLSQSIDGALKVIGANERFARMGEIFSEERRYFQSNRLGIRQNLGVIDFLRESRRLLSVINEYDSIKEGYIESKVNFGIGNDPQWVSDCAVPGYLSRKRLGNIDKYSGKVTFETQGLEGEIVSGTYESGLDSAIEIGLFVPGGIGAVLSAIVGCAASIVCLVELNPFPLVLLGLIPSIGSMNYSGKFRDGVENSKGLVLTMSPKLDAYSTEDLQRYEALDQRLRSFKL